MIGQKFNKWTVLEFSHSHPKSKNYIYKCVCNCGKEGLVSGSNLRNGKSKQCQSCSNKINGKQGHRPKKHLYMIQCGPYVKIGTTDDIKTRMISLRVYNPYPIKLVGYWENYGHKEKEWHRILKDEHHQGEWFKLGTAGHCEI